MENKTVGWLIIGIAIAMALIVWLFNIGLNKIVSATCSHGSSCTMYQTINTQTYLSLIIIGIIVIIGLFIMFSKPKEKIIIKTLKEKKKKLDLSKLDLDEKEKQVLEILQNENGAIFQSTLIEKLNIGKVGITRLIDKLEAKQLVERKRRGMNNIIVLKN